jgi:hypothetical protein
LADSLKVGDLSTEESRSLEDGMVMKTPTPSSELDDVPLSSSSPSPSSSTSQQPQSLHHHHPATTTTLVANNHAAPSLSGKMTNGSPGSLAGKTKQQCGDDAALGSPKREIAVCGHGD